jgi:hypothetical protein
MADYGESKQYLTVWLLTPLISNALTLTAYFTHFFSNKDTRAFYFCATVGSYAGLDSSDILADKNFLNLLYYIIYFLAFLIVSYLLVGLVLRKSSTKRDRILRTLSNILAYTAESYFNYFAALIYRVVQESLVSTKGGYNF